MYKSVDEVILQHSTRGMDKLQKLHPKEHCKEAVEHFVKLQKGNVFLYTGFYVGGFAETDGPLGAYFLARTLKKIGFHPIIITDSYCKDYFKEIQTLYIPLAGYTKEENLKLLETYSPICHISIERCGKNINGVYENAWKANITQFTAPLDELYQLGGKRSPTFAIADGGNEIGMGNFKDSIKEHLGLNPCAVSCDFPVIASVSNWGAYGLIAYLQKHYKQKLLPTFEEVDAYLKYIISLDCVDGIIGVNSHSVDGKDWGIEKIILQELEDSVCEHFQ